MKQIFAGALVALYLLAGPLPADQPRPFPEFSAKRVGVPKPGARRLTVQIDPDAQQAALAALPKPGDREPLEPPAGVPPGAPMEPNGGFAWFWERVSPSLASANPGRLPSAMDVLLGREEIPQPRLAQLQQIAQTNGPEILRATIGTQVSPALVLAVISVESSGRSDAVSGAGAQGLMQLMPATAERFGVSDSLEPEENITGGVKYLDWLMQEFEGDPIMVLAGYNAGEGSVQKYEGVPPYPETRGYVPKVLAAYQVARGLCRTPPELLSDGCVFVGMN
ncbi:MAG: lytic transglycosylase domain-containing protein [Pseudomonadota bacterium]